MLRVATIALGLVLAPGVAFANSCTMQIAGIEKAMAKSKKISSSDLAKVKQLLKQGTDLHNAGNHEAAEALLSDAKRLLGG
jgi:hypothetical protein